MAQLRWPTLVPLGQITVAAAGTPVSMAVNCGSLGGQTWTVPYNYDNPPISGTPLRQVIITNQGGGNIYILPRGYTASANPNFIIACIPAGVTLAIPQGQPFENGILPENFVIDADTSGAILYGCGIIS